MQVSFLESMSEIGAAEWNALSGDTYPFLRHEFLTAAEAGGCVSPDTGWRPRHAVVTDESGCLLAAMPLYEKTHSWGEFVFDWAWAQAYQRVGLDYYPKLVSAVPFTPAPSTRLLLRDPADARLPGMLLEAALELARDRGCSSLHVQFPTREELGPLCEAGLKLRKDCQFHWHNRGYESFDQFLATFSSAKRKKAKRDRRIVADQGISFRWLHGGDTDRAIWRDVYELISLTFLRRGSMPYYDAEFFAEVSRRLPQNILVVLAERRRVTIAAAVFYVSARRLYGRYWGSDADYNALHFETCYYQGIEYCIANRQRVFEPGTQGEHKISRGFTPVPTWSAHWLARPEFFSVIGEYLEDEQQHIDRYIDAVKLHSPYRRGNGTRSE